MTDKQKTSPEEDMAAELMLKEADEALRQEEMQKIWQEWGATIIGVALMVVFGTMIGVGWKSWRTSVYESQTEQLLSIQDQGVGALITKSSDLSGRYEAIAKMMAAGDLARAENSSSKITASTIHNLMVDVTDENLPKYYKFLAQWAKLRTAFDASEADARADIAKDMLDLAGKRRNPFEVAIMVEAALMYASMNDYQNAVDVLNDIDKEELEKVPALMADVQSYKQLFQAKLEEGKAE